jgi:hypothetical protein
MTSPSPKKFRFGLLLAGAGVLVIVGYVGAWFSAASVLKNQSARWIEAQRSSGYTINHAEPAVSGFPFEVVITYADWSMRAPVTNNGWVWRTPAITVSAQPFAPLSFTVDLAGEHKVSGLWTPPGVDAKLTATQASFRPTLTTEGRIAEIVAAIENLNSTGIRGDQSLVGIESAALSVVHIRDAEKPSWQIKADVTNWHAPLMENTSAFGEKIRKLSVDATLEGTLPSGTLPQALKTWHESGGTLEVRELLFDWPPLAVNATGTLALDRQLQPVGALTATFRGFMESLDALAKQNTIERRDADTAQTVLGLLAKKPEGGGAPELNISVAVQDHKLYVGPVPLMELEPVEWPKEILIP